MLKRIGLLVPSSNTTMEPDFAHAFEGRATVHAARMLLESPFTPDGERLMVTEHAARAATELATLSPDVVVFGCTSAGALLGRDGEEELLGRLREAAGTEVVGVVGPLVSWLRRRGISRTALLTPYTDLLNESLSNVLVSSGQELTAIYGMQQDDNCAIGKIAPATVVDAVSRLSTTSAEAIAIACTNLRALEARDLIERMTGKLVVTASSAVIESVEELLGMS